MNLKSSTPTRLHTRRAALLALIPAALLLNLGGAASAATFTPPVVASDPSPYASCTVGGAPGAVNYPNAEVEPWVAVNPKNPLNVVGVWQQDRWSDGGAHGLVAGYSNDGGASWRESAQPFSACAAGGPARFDRASDPWVSFGPDGTAYSVSISFQGVGADNGVAAATSTDGGKTWGNLNILKEDTTFQFFNDKESVTADPVHAGTAYAVWDRLVAPNGNPRADAHTHAFTGPAWFAKTTDGGKTWGSTQIIVPTAEHQQTIGNQIVVDPRTGTLYDFFNLILSSGPNGAGDLHGNNVAFVKSTDGGVTWTAPQVVAKLGTVGVTDPNTGAPIRTGDIIPEPAIDPASGQLYVVWQDARFSGGVFDEVALSSSPDGGATWSAPHRVSTDTGRPAFTPSVRVNSGGTVAVTYYDFRSLGAGNTTTLPTDYWFTSSPAGGAAFGNETHLYGPFDMLTAPNARGFFVGDYEGLAASGGSFASLSVRANDGNTANRTDAVFTAVHP
ncbi:sialidase family protein [Sinomonas sp. ASV322]|uniref:sialidase family protein n=1 Tax=Sinomonas sp. ASV322 TaxID=3041920 RepID=UPI0027DE718C|nr:sialidase family protein [Sinomonas sp. ASV322]MDQ4504564.1 sialidase family protein [Sinomonas sp. ASV322]